MNIAFIGLGNMGGPMAANLVKAGYAVTGFDVGDKAVHMAREVGVDVRSSAAGAAENADVVITMLPNGGLVNKVVGEVLPALAGESVLFIDSSTAAVSESRAIAEKITGAGHRFIDAPVSGGTVGAQAGSLAFMVGGDEEDVAQAQPLFDIMGRVTTHCGDVGAGEAAKLCNNMVLGVHQVAIAEALILGQRLGLEPKVMYDVISGSTGGSWALTTNCPIPGVVDSAASNRDFDGGFGTDLIIKDMGLAAKSAEETNTPTPLGDHAATFYQQASEEGLGRKDFSVVIQLLEKMSRQ